MADSLPENPVPNSGEATEGPTPDVTLPLKKVQKALNLLSATGKTSGEAISKTAPLPVMPDDSKIKNAPGLRKADPKNVLPVTVTLKPRVTIQPVEGSAPAAPVPDAGATAARVVPPPKVASGPRTGPVPPPPPPPGSMEVAAKLAPASSVKPGSVDVTVKLKPGEIPAISPQVPAAGAADRGTPPPYISPAAVEPAAAQIKPSPPINPIPSSLGSTRKPTAPMPPAQKQDLMKSTGRIVLPEGAAPEPQPAPPPPQIMPAIPAAPKPAASAVPAAPVAAFNPPPAQPAKPAAPAAPPVSPPIAPPAAPAVVAPQPPMSTITPPPAIPAPAKPDSGPMRTISPPPAPAAPPVVQSKPASTALPPSPKVPPPTATPASPLATKSAAPQTPPAGIAPMPLKLNKAAHSAPVAGAPGTPTRAGSKMNLLLATVSAIIIWLTAGYLIASYANMI